MTAPTGLLEPRLLRLDRRQVQPFLDRLNTWLLPDAAYGAQHTWPQLYRSDGDGRFTALLDGDHLVSHCAWRPATAHTADGPRRIALLGSVATDPAQRGRGHGGRVLRAALDDCRREGVDAVLLWAERPELYERAGFAPTVGDRCVALQLDTAPTRATVGDVRLATVADHGRLAELHAQKPLRIDRSDRAMSGLLTTPGLWTWVLQRDDRVVAYACTGKGADLQGWWHELGGSDADVAALLPEACRLCALPQSLLLVPPYRPLLPALLGASIVDEAEVQGPMVCRLGDAPLPALFVDGLDSV